MTSRDFCYWLQGFFELNALGVNKAQPMVSSDQADLIKRHLALVFKHEIDPSAGGPEKQAELNAIHTPAGEGLSLKPSRNDIMIRC